MRDWKELGRKFLFPPIWLIMILAVVSAIVLVAIFVNGWETNPMTCIFYVVAFYTLTVMSMLCWKVIPRYYKAIKAKLHENKYANRYLTDVVFKTEMGLYRSLAINLIYVIAMYTFYIIITAIIDMVKYRKYKSPVMSITKVIKMASALFSMLFLETAMFAQFGTETSPETKRIMIMATGAGISVAVVSMAIYMIVQTSKEIRSRFKNGK